MIGKEPESLEKFPVPVVGTPIPRGWFSRLVAFMNSLVLRGDEQYFCVKRSNGGTSITPTKKLVDLLHTRGGGAPGSGGGGISSFGFPDLTAGTPVQLGSQRTTTAPIWLIGTVGIDFLNSSSYADVTLTIFNSSGILLSQSLIYCYQDNQPDRHLSNLRWPVCMPIMSGVTYECSATGTGSALDPLLFDVSSYPLITL